MKCYLEHANITVADLDRTVDFLTTAFPDFRVRGRGETETGGTRRQWLHLGTDETYIALEEVFAGDHAAGGDRRPYLDVGINHVGFVVEDVETLVRRLEEAGYRQSIAADEHPHRKRFYFYDGDRIEYEFVEYLSDDPAERNDYTR